MTMSTNPAATIEKTSRSRGVTVVARLKRVSPVASEARSRLREQAPLRPRLATQVLVNGFARKFTAPAFSACTVVATSPWPLMNTIGRSRRS